MSKDTLCLIYLLIISSTVFICFWINWKVLFSILISNTEFIGYGFIKSAHASIRDICPNLKYRGIWYWLSIFPILIPASILTCVESNTIKYQFNLCDYVPMQTILLIYMSFTVISGVSIAMCLFKMIIGEENEDKKMIKNITTLYDVFYVGSGLLAAILFFIIDAAHAAGAEIFLSNSVLKGTLLLPFSFRFAKALIDRRYR